MLMSHAVAANVGCPEVELNHYLWTFKPALAPRKLSGRMGVHEDTPASKTTIRLSESRLFKIAARVVPDSHSGEVTPGRALL